jgi:hypothetical protein
MRIAFWFRFLRRGVGGAVLVYVVVILTLGGTRAAQPVLYGLIGLWLVVHAAASEWSTRQHRALRLAYWFDVLATNLALTLVLGEAALQLVAAVNGQSVLCTATLDAHRLRPGYDYGDGLVGNRLGYPGPELCPARKPGVVRVAALGDSFAVGPAVPFADNYLTRLAGVAGVEVGNFGLSGAGPREYRAILERDVWPVRPDLVLVSVFVGNDITETLPQPRCLDPRRHALYLLVQRGWRLLREQVRGAGGLGTRAPEGLARRGLSPQTFREVEARRLAVCVKEPSPAMDKKWQRTLHELGRIVAACRQHGTRVAVVLIPDEFQVNAAVLQDALQEAGLTPGQIDLDLPQRRLREFFDQQAVACLDLLPAFRGVPDTYAPRDTHWNVAGNHLAARQIGQWLPEVLRRPTE